MPGTGADTGTVFEAGTFAPEPAAQRVGMKRQPDKDHAEKTDRRQDDLRAWIIIGLIFSAATLALWASLVVGHYLL